MTSLPLRPVRARAIAAALAFATCTAVGLAPSGAGAQEDAGSVADAAADVAIADDATRVVGGARTSIVEWPSVVALLHPGELRAPFDRQFCGGTVIASRWVLTAAHCLYDLFGAPMDAGSLVVLPGQTNLREPSEGRELVVANVIRHPGYVDDATGRTRDDIALLELAVEIPAPASELFAGDPGNYPGAPAAIVGWGATEYAPIGSPPFPDELREALVPIVPADVCNGPDSYAGDVAEGQFCAGFPEGGVDSCTGDSGGPLYVRIDERVQLAGVTSFGRGCALPGFYGIYTDVSAYLDWITTYVELPIVPVPPRVVTAAPVQTATAPRAPGGGGAAGDVPPAPESSGGGGGATGAAALALLGIAAWRRRAAGRDVRRRG